MMKKTVAFFAALLFAAISVFAQNSLTKTVQATGFGKTVTTAEEDAVIRAVKSATGLQLAVSEQSTTRTTEESHDISVGGKEVAIEHVEISDQLSKSIVTRAQGRIKRYEVLSKQFDENKKQWEVLVAVEVYGQYVLGRDPNKLRRMFIADFRPVNGTSIRLYGSAWSMFSPTEKFRLKAEDIFTASRKFTMLDRQNSAAVDQELRMANDPNFNTADLYRLGNKLMADYMVVGEIEFFSPPAPYEDKFTGNIIVPDGLVAKIHYRVIFVPTQQLKCSGSIKVSVSELTGSTAAEIASAAMEYGAEKAVSRIMEGILPFRIAQVAGGTIVINQGGDTLHIGERLGVYAQGEAISDPATGEVIDHIEIPVGDITINRITPKLSYGEVLRGKVEDMKIGCILRRYTEEEMSAAKQEPVERNDNNKAHKDYVKKLSRVRKLCGMPPDYSAAGKWFELSKELENEELRQMLLQAAGLALFNANKHDLYNEKIRPLLNSASLFENSLSVVCPACSGERTVEMNCLNCGGNGRCRFVKCQEGRYLVHDVIGAHYEMCRECRGTGNCQKCGGAGLRELKCTRCKGNGSIIGRETVVEAYQKLVDAIPRAFEK